MTGQTPAAARRMRATLIGFAAILLWSLLALLSAASGKTPPLMMNALTFSIGALTGVIWMRLKGAWPKLPKGQGAAVALGTAGLFLYHFLYFTAIRNAPAVEASLIAYLWPLLIVVGSALLPGESLKAHHVFGALIGLGGAALILIARGGGLSGGGSILGYGAAFGCAFTWAAYSLLARRFADVPTEAVIFYCAGTAVLSGLLHPFLEQTVWPEGAMQWLAVLLLGAGPVGLAFYVWDIGCKAGDIQVLGASSYAAPLLSTLILILAGMTEPTPSVLGACLLITLGAAVAAKDMILRRTRQ